MHCPRLTFVKQSADYTGFIYIDFGMFFEPVVGPYMFCEPGECLFSDVRLGSMDAFEILFIYR